MGIPIHSKLRRVLRTSINTLLVRLSHPQLNQQPIDPTTIKRILVIRINYRIGNILFLTPLLRALSIKMPDATVDLLIGAHYISPIIKPIANVGEVYDIPRKILRNPLNIAKKVQQLNANQYDLIISPAIASASANITTLLLKAKHKLGFYHKKTWNAVSTTVPFPHTVAHEALKPLALMAAFGADHMQYTQCLDIQLTPQEKHVGYAKLAKLLIENNVYISHNLCCVALFRDARHDKKIKDDWWLNFVNKLTKRYPDLVLIDVLAPNVTDKISNRSIAISIENLRELGGFISALDLFICADTGPMHLATAVNLPVVALFNATSPEMYGPLGEQHKVIDIVDKTVDDIVEITATQLAKVIVCDMKN